MSVFQALVKIIDQITNFNEMHKGRIAPYVIKAVRPFTELLPPSTNQYCLRDGFTKKIAVLLDFVQ